jgi:hypothetical protein
VYARLITAASAFTTTTGYVINVDAPSLGNTAVTTIYGINVANQGQAKSTNAYGVYIAAQSGASTINIGLYNAGTTTLVGAVICSATIAVAGNVTGNTNKWGFTATTGALGVGGLPTATSVLNITGLPVAAAGLAAGDVWNNSGVLPIV